jgi:lipopolysaccharide transport system ATP-binding protein
VSEVVLRVENLWKQYRLGVVGVGSLREDVGRWWAKLRGKEDPTLKIGETNDRESLKGQYVWALQDINFEVKRGDVLGIIGKNGAGKSTLLKILSKVTTPTKGVVRTKGRIASLLEVGTGFHPELTGRENIFLNGAILGMTKNDIRKRFDEIVEFSGVGKYIDTPVKRYSSGMYVRLAFAVAAHLEPEILIIDEVLAVGDAEFQKKCLGKMKDVSGEGRTVLFVSHNMQAIESLCSTCLYLKNGKYFSYGTSKQIVSQYVSIELRARNEVVYENNKPGDEYARLNYVRLIDENRNLISYPSIDKKIGIECEYEILKKGCYPVPNIHVFTNKGDYVFVASEPAKQVQTSIGTHRTTAWIPENTLNTGSYIIGVAASTLNPVIVHFYENEALVFDTTEDMENRTNEYRQEFPGVVRPVLQWESTPVCKLL